MPAVYDHASPFIEKTLPASPYINAKKIDALAIELTNIVQQTNSQIKKLGEVCRDLLDRQIVLIDEVEKLKHQIEEKSDQIKEHQIVQS
ncbi:MAG: hypothetical protein WC525_07535 [Candidatus Thermoplasmatota archaeon]